MVHACALDKARQIFFYMAALAEKYRNDTNGRRALLEQRRNRLVERRAHQLEIGEQHWLLARARQRGGELLERPSPFGVARAVRKEDDAGAQ